MPPSPHAPRPEEEVSPEHLQKNHLLGGGGYASVWLTTDARTGKQYALKQLRKGVAVQLMFTERCLLEKARSPRRDTHSIAAHPDGRRRRTR